MDLLLFLQGIRNGFLDAFFSGITFVGTQVVIILLVSVNYWYTDKKFACELGASFFLSSALVQGVKITCRVPRPFVRDTRIVPVRSAVAGATGYSFPSGHTQTASSALIPAAYEFRKKKAVPVLCGIVILLVIISRMYLGVHTPADVSVSFVITSACAAGVMYFGRRHGQDMILLINAGLNVILCIYAVTLYKNGTVEAGFAADPLKSAGAGVAFSAGVMLEKKYIRSESEKLPVGAGVIKIALGLFGTGIIYFSKALYSESMLLDFARYFAVVFWITLIYPALFSKTERKILLKEEVSHEQ